MLARILRCRLVPSVLVATRASVIRRWIGDEHVAGCIPWLLMFGALACSVNGGGHRNAPVVPEKPPDTELSSVQPEAVDRRPGPDQPGVQPGVPVQTGAPTTDCDGTYSAYKELLTSMRRCHRGADCQLYSMAQYLDPSLPCPIYLNRKAETNSLRRIKEILNACRYQIVDCAVTTPKCVNGQCT